MYKHKLSAICLFALALFFSCNNVQPPAPAKSVLLASVNFEKNSGRDCAKMDSIHNHCAEVKLRWPEVKDGPEALKTAVTAWTNTFIISLLAPADGDSTISKMSIESATQDFQQMHSDWSKEAPDSPMGEWFVESKDTVLLNDGKHLTLEIDANTFSGGAHGLSLAAVTSFEVATGKTLTWADLVNDPKQFQSVVEQKFKTTRPELFKSEQEGGLGFQFDETNPFQLPNNYGLTDKGIYCVFVPYEVTPYAFGSTEFVIPFEEVGSNLKLKK